MVGGPVDEQYYPDDVNIAWNIGAFEWEVVTQTNWGRPVNENVSYYDRSTF